MTRQAIYRAALTTVSAAVILTGLAALLITQLAQ